MTTAPARTHVSRNPADLRDAVAEVPRADAGELVGQLRTLSWDGAGRRQKARVGIADLPHNDSFRLA